MRCARTGGLREWAFVRPTTACENCVPWVPPPPPSQVEESNTDGARVALVFSSQGLPYSMGRAALDSMETTYDLVFPDPATKEKFVGEVGAHMLLCAWPCCGRSGHALCSERWWGREGWGCGQEAHGRGGDEHAPVCVPLLYS